ncbi:hypothetical protein, partial [Phaeobacter sp. 22II1-1F12B]|uniref:hypothetical protein n=1 Tax=Phaeobacter sp. 22II1-1F12B TaxID=1317111 RepID=UPI001E4D02D3
QAHNLKVAGSNPAPATNFSQQAAARRLSAFLVWEVSQNYEIARGWACLFPLIDRRLPCGWTFAKVEENCLAKRFADASYLKLHLGRSVRKFGPCTV